MLVEVVPFQCFTISSRCFLFVFGFVFLIFYVMELSNQEGGPPAIDAEPFFQLPFFQTDFSKKRSGNTINLLLHGRW